MTSASKFTDRLFEPVDSFSTDFFRSLFGIAMILQFISFMKLGFIDIGILAPRFLFTYDFADFVKPISPLFVKFIMLLMLASAVLIAVNKLYRAGIIVFLFSFSWLLLLEKSYYNNHFYLIILLSIIYLFYKPISSSNKNSSFVPAWFPWLLRFQLIVVYFYGGLAKLNHDWLVNCQPVKILLEANAKDSAFPSLFDSSFAVYYLTYGGIVFDLAIGFLLVYKPTIKFAVILTVFFHLTNLFIFNFGEGGDIGIFPLLMIFSNVMFIPSDALRKLFSKFSFLKMNPAFKKIKLKKEENISSVNFSTKKKLVIMCLSVYVAFQMLFPFRHLLFPGNVDWTGEAQRFSWRMKMYVKSGDLNISVKKTKDDTPVLIDWKKHINEVQYTAMRDHPEMLLQFAQYLKKLSRQKGFNTIIVNAELKLSMNGLPEQYVVDPSLDLLSVKRSPFRHQDWILPLKENQ